MSDTHSHSHPHSQNHHPNHAHSLWEKIAAALHLPGFAHSHDTTALSAEIQQNTLAIRTVWLALCALTLTSILQIGIVAFSGSVALLADTAHNIGDSLNSIPLLIAFYLGRRAATRRFTYGFARAEDVAGIFIVLSIAFSAGVVLWQSADKLFNPQPLTHLPWVAAAAIIGFVGNEAVALLQIRVGQQINSAAMIADGIHARVDGFTSLAVLIAVVGTASGAPILDPLVGLFIGVAIVFITKEAALHIGYRLMDAIDPALTEKIEQLTAALPDVGTIQQLRARWLGHRLLVELTITPQSLMQVSDYAALQAKISQQLHDQLPQIAHIHIEFSLGQPHTETLPVTTAILPPHYQGNLTISAAPMGAAALVYNADGSVAWDEIWTDFCDLALAGGPPHRGTLLEPVDPAAALQAPEQYARVLAELERGLKLVTGLEVEPSPTPGWIGLVCTSEDMAIWLLRAIVVENISVRREKHCLFFPASPHFRLEYEIKNVITVVAKTTHYWHEHLATVS